MLIGLNTTSTYSRSNSCPISLDAMCPFPSTTLDKQERKRKKKSVLEKIRVQKENVIVKCSNGDFKQ